jgi:hypothetical protein
MSRHFQVIGDDGEVEGSVLGDVHTTTGDGDYEIVGYTPEGNAIVGRAARRRRGASAVQVQRPAWRDKQLAPGVIAPDEGLLPLPMGEVTLTASVQTFTFSGQMQKPFRGERLLVTTTRTGTSAVGKIKGLIYVGTDLAQLTTSPYDLEAVGAPGAFGVRLTMKPAQPGVFITIPITLSSALSGSDTLYVNVNLLGRLVH